MSMSQRKLCVKCQRNYRAYNYRKGDKIYYRRQCETCLYGNKDKVRIPQWARKGYRKKSQCENCGFRAKELTQLNVYFVDGNLKNCDPLNLKTICANCQRLEVIRNMGWSSSDLTPDF